MTADAYIARQTLLAFFLALGTAAPFAWITGSLRLLSLVVEGSDPLAFLKVSAFLLPEALAYLAPLLGFFACVWTIHRMTGDNEMFAMAFAGASPWRLARPFLILAGVLAAGLAVAHFYVVPGSKRAFKETLIAERARFVVAAAGAGAFATPAPGVTVFIHERQGRDRFLGLLVHDERQEDLAYTYAADEAVFVDDPAGPLLVMFNGSLHAAPRDARKRSSTVARFDKFTLDLAFLLGEPGGSQLKDSRRYLHELVGPAAQPRDDGERRRFLAQAHVRLARITMPLALIVLAAALLLASPPRRRHSARGVLVATALAAGLIVASFTAERIASRAPWRWEIAHLPNLVCFIACGIRLWMRGRLLPTTKHVPPDAPPDVPPGAPPS